MKQKPGIATRAVLLVVSLLWAIPLIWSVLTALKPSKESMLLQLPSTLTLENFQVVFDSAPFLQYGLNTFLIVAGRSTDSGGAAGYGNDGGLCPGVR